MTKALHTLLVCVLKHQALRAAGAPNLCTALAWCTMKRMRHPMARSLPRRWLSVSAPSAPLAAGHRRPRQKMGLYDPAQEKDSCGVGLVAHLKVGKRRAPLVAPVPRARA